MKDLVIDLSHWNPVDSWDAIKDSGIVGVIHKATEGAGYVDDTYHERMAEALEAGLLWGAYHFMRPGNMKDQAQHFVEAAGEIDIYAADHEDSAVSLEDLKEFLVEVEELTGRVPVVYSGHVIKEQVGNKHDNELANYPLWLAHYTSGSPSWPDNTWPEWWIWQYTDTGSTDGVDGYCDRNRYDGPEDQLIAEWTDIEPVPIPPEPEPGPEPEPEAAEVVITISVKTKGAQVKVVAEQEDDNAGRTDR